MKKGTVITIMLVAVILWLAMMQLSCKKEQMSYGPSGPDSSQVSFTLNETHPTYSLAHETDVYMEIIFQAGTPAVTYHEQFFREYVDGNFHHKKINRYESINGSTYSLMDSWTNPDLSGQQLYSWKFTAWHGGQEPQNLIPETSTLTR